MDRRILGLSFGLFFVLTSCVDEQSNRTRPSLLAPPSPQFSSDVWAGAEYDLDAQWAQVAREEVPGFAGYYRSPAGTYVVSVARAESARQAEALVASRLAAAGKRGVVTESRLVVYAFDELKAWKDALAPLVDGEDIYWLDIAEEQNRLVLGVRSPAVAHQVLEAAARLGVPAPAVDAIQSRKPTPRSDIRDHIDPVTGGTEIQRSGYVRCTLGFNAYSGTLAGFVTASHCSGTENSTDGTVQYQSDWGVTADSIGAEYNDPSSNRMSDAAFYLYASGLGRVPDWGQIARTTDVGIGESGSLTIDTQHPRFRIVGKAPNAVQGLYEVVNKVGRTTGWTQGEVTQTCVTLRGYSCQWRAELWSWQGDSGAPIFQQLGSTEPDASRVILWGILQGGPENDSSETWYSPMSGIEHDLGTLGVACDSLATACAPIFVAIDGPNYITSSDDYEWEAMPSGGDSTYTYAWYYRINYQTPTCVYQTDWTLVSTSKTYARHVSLPGYDFQLDVVVSSGGQEKSAGMGVYLSSHRACPAR